MAEDKETNTEDKSLFEQFDTQEGIVAGEDIEYDGDENSGSGFDIEIEDASEEISPIDNGIHINESVVSPEAENEKPSEITKDVQNDVSSGNTVPESQKEVSSEAEDSGEYQSKVIPSVDIADVDPEYKDSAVTVADESFDLSTEDDVELEEDVIENDPDASGEENSVDESETILSTKDKDGEETFMSFNDAQNMKGGKKGKEPDQLNKKKIVYITFGIIAFLGLFMILKPESWTLAKKEDKKKPEASKTEYRDYEKNAKNTINTDPYDVPRPSFDETGVNSKYTENSSTAKPLDDAYQVAYSQQSGGYVGGQAGGYTVEVPDTRNDRLQGKTISGIKGLTSTQESYATNYEIQKEMNSKEAASNTRVTGSSSMRNSLDPDKYSSQLLSSLNTNSYESQNDQKGKSSFYNQNRGTGGAGLWLGLNTIWQGTIFNVVLTSEINTDLPGEVTGRVSKNVYSSQDGRFLLIPQNSVLIGNYNSSISYSQSRAQVIWHTLIRPDGYQINLGAMNGTDTKGSAGLKGFVNDHPMAYVKAILLMSTFSIINGEFQATQKETNNQYVQNIAANSQEMVNKLGEKLIDRAMDVQPTSVIKAGTEVNVVVNQNLTLPEYKKHEITQKYMNGKNPKELFQ